ncbi:TetR/AcrR family transcriptional regulator [Acidocella sp.]|uniref:TetR/AcrR family transcriptional regulator n=1 Tax=Acidocella sp. TaxID=50710 RepID=UPI003CFDFBDF
MAGAAGPRRTARGEAREAALRDRAGEMFLARGYDGFSLDELVRDVGGSKGAVYSFYGGKDGLFVAAMESLIEEITVPVKQLSLDGLSVEEGLRRFAATLLAMLLLPRHLDFQRLVIAEGRRHPQVAADWYRVGPRATHAILARFLATAQARGTIRPEPDPTAVAVLFHNMVVFDLMTRALTGTDIPGIDAVATTIDHAVSFTAAALLPGTGS